MIAAVRTIAALLFLLACAAPLPAGQAQPPEQQEEFIPVEDLPPTEQIPAAPLLIGAYAFVIVVLFLYLVSVSRRLVVVQREVQRLEADMKRSGRG
jgi:CcmD family protein